MKVWVNGCFDILHDGHLDLLEYAASFGDVFIGIDSDRRVKEMKGDERPINSESFRARMLLSLKFVKNVFVFDNNMELESIMGFVSPDVFVIGDDYRDKKIVGGHIPTRIVFYPIKKGFSTTNLINQINNR
jgi:D-beta-D-heptose 7-phosphate kinase/D-beta-D-heptose 1-phosphate adenosyltransferase